MNRRSPPAPPESEDVQRWAVTGLRVRMLQGDWRRDLETVIHRQLGAVRREAQGQVSIGVNPFRTLCRELAVLYDTPPTVATTATISAAAAQVVDLGLSFAGYWSAMQDVQAMCLGAREWLVRLEREERPDLPVRHYVRAVRPDLVVCRASPWAPSVPVVVEEAQLRERDEVEEWVWECWDAEARRYAILSADRSRDLTEEYGATGDWPTWLVDEVGRGTVPYVLHHARQKTDRMWDYTEGQELVDGTMDAAVLDNMVRHVALDASWPQRWILGARPMGAGLSGSDDGRQHSIVTDPASVLLLESDGETQGQPQVGQWAAGADASMLDGVLADRLARLAQDAGVPPSDLQRSGTARSGAAIALTNEGKRRAQARYSEAFRAGDERMCRLLAMSINADPLLGLTLPTTGYEVVYTKIPLSPEELDARRRNALELLAAGLMSRVQAYAEVHGVSMDAAAEAVRTMTPGPEVSGPPSADVS